MKDEELELNLPSKPEEVLVRESKEEEIIISLLKFQESILKQEEKGANWINFVEEEDVITVRSGNIPGLSVFSAEWSCHLKKATIETCKSIFKSDKVYLYMNICS